MYIVLDCETTNTFDDPIIYDLGWSVLDENFELIKTQSFVIADVFLEEKNLMKEAYFADKIPQYIADIADGKRTLKRFKNVRLALIEDCIAYKLKAIIAHNARFDYIACQTTQRWLTSSKFRWFFPYGIMIADTLKMSKQVLGKDESYLKFCSENGYCINNNPKRPGFTAEILYRYITQNLDFEESHTGLEDTLIEKEIFIYCYKKDPTVLKSVWD